MLYVTFSKHDHTTLERKPGDKYLFAYPTDAGGRARLMAQTIAHELRDYYDDGIVSFVRNGQQGPMWIVFNGPKSYGTFYVKESSEVYDAVMEPDWDSVQAAVAGL